MAMRLAVVAVQTLAVFSALHTSAITLAVVFPTGGLLTGASAQGYEGRHPLESSRVPIVGHLLRLVDVELAAILVAAGIAVALLIAESALREALAVHLEAINFGALATRVVLAAGRQVQLRDSAQNILVVLPGEVLLQQFVEKISAGVFQKYLGLHNGIGDEFEGSRGRRGTSRSHF
jgi:hypothetical protein